MNILVVVVIQILMMIPSLDSTSLLLIGDSVDRFTVEDWCKHKGLGVEDKNGQWGAWDSDWGEGN
jgi:hypothetical protein